MRTSNNRKNKVCRLFPPGGYMLYYIVSVGVGLSQEIHFDMKYIYAILYSFRWGWVGLSQEIHFDIEMISIYLGLG